MGTPDVGHDFSLYYRAVNNTLNNDDEQLLVAAMPLIQCMVREIRYTESGERRLHPGGRLYKGDQQRPVPLNLQKLRDAHEDGRAVRFRQFQSTSSDDRLAEKYRKRDGGKGFFWTIDVPEGYWGAQDISDVASKKRESETLFVPYAPFQVLAVDEDSCHLKALDFSVEFSERLARNCQGASVCHI